MQILVVGIRAKPDTTITIFSATAENSGMTVLNFAGTVENSGVINAGTGGEKWPKIDGNYGMIGESCSRTRGTRDMIDAPGGRRAWR